jgi:hypothetical protein
MQVMLGFDLGLKRKIVTKRDVFLGLGLLLACLLPTAAYADGVAITSDLPFVDIGYADKMVRIERIQDQNNKLNNSFSKTSRACPAFCVHPMQAALGVVSVDELEFSIC